jgi:hypothetical protein
MIAREVAAEMGPKKTEMDNVWVAAQLHDIGKIGIAGSILPKDIEQLASYELKEYQKHPIRGQAAMDSNDALREAAALVRSHHELMNGQGFPDGLSGRTIPLGSRIITIADKYDRFVATRSMNAALEEIRSLRGSHFDPELYYPLEIAAKKTSTAVGNIGRHVEQLLTPQSLLSGMVLSRELRSGTGVLLAPKGVTLTVKKIETIKRYFLIDPPETDGIAVWGNP